MQETQKIRMKTVISAILISLLAMLSAACAAGTASNNAEQIHTASGEVFAMDTYMKITCSGQRSEEALEAAIAEIQRLDALLSVSGEESDINAVNTFGKAKISEDTAHIIEKESSAHEWSFRYQHISDNAALGVYRFGVQGSAKGRT